MSESAYHLNREQAVEIERVAAVSDRAILAVARVLASAIRDDGELWLAGEPLTIDCLRATVGDVFLTAGLRQPQGNLIAVGPAAAEPHHEGCDERRIGIGESILVDLFPRSASAELPVFSDCSRTFCIGIETASALPLVRAAADVVSVKAIVESELADSLKVVGCARGFELQRLACDAFRRLGWAAQVSSDGLTKSLEEGYVHGLGHGVGRGLHQHPTFSAEYADEPEGLIEPLQAITIEPGLYVPGAFGVRFEDLWLVESSRCESVSRAVSGSGPDCSKAGEVSCEQPEFATEIEAGRPIARLRRLTQLPWALDPKEFLALAAARA